jgi:hypothetical protein
VQRLYTRTSPYYSLISDYCVYTIAHLRHQPPFGCAKPSLSAHWHYLWPKGPDQTNLMDDARAHQSTRQCFASRVPPSKAPFRVPFVSLLLRVLCLDPISTLEVLSVSFSLSPYTPLLVVVPFVSRILFLRSSSHTFLVRLRYAFLFPSISLSLGTPPGRFMMCRTRQYISVLNRRSETILASLSSLDDLFVMFSYPDGFSSCIKAFETN